MIIDIMEQSGTSEALVEFISRCGVIRSKEVVEAGFSRIMLTRLVRGGQLQRLGKGLYAAPGHVLTEWHDLAEAAKAIPSAVVSLISALAFHEIGTQMPQQIWITLPKGAREPTYHRPLRVTRFSEPSLSAGVEVHEIEGVPVRVYGAAKTVCDCFRMRSKVGYDVAIEALKDGWRLRKFTMSELDSFARINKVRRIITPYLEAILS